MNCFGGSGRIFTSPRSPKPLKCKPSPLSFSPNFHFSPLSPARTTSISPGPKKRLSMSMSSPVNYTSSSETRSAFDFVGGNTKGLIPTPSRRDIGVQCTLLTGQPLVWPPPPQSSHNPPPAPPSLTLGPPSASTIITSPGLPPPLMPSPGPPPQSPSLAACPVASRTFPITTTKDDRCTDSPDSITIEVHDYGKIHIIH